MSEIKIEAPTLEDKKRLQEFYARIYRPDHVLMNDRFLNWWLHDNPYWKGDGYSCNIAVDGEKIIGHFAHAPCDIWAKGTIYKGAWTGNFIVDESYRGRGLGTMLINAVMNQYQTTMDIGANTLAEGILQKKGWVHFGNLHRYVGIFDQDAARPLALDMSVLSHLVIKQLKKGAPEIFEIKEFSQKYDEFWNVYKKDITASTDKTAKFLNWRYAKHPIFKYRMFEIRENGTENILGIMIFRIDEIKDNKLSDKYAIRIVEFAALPGAGEHLLYYLIYLVKEKRIREEILLIDFFNSSKKYGKVFESFGFSDLPYSNQIARLFSPVVLSRREISFNGANCRGELPNELFEDQELWYVTSGDGDQDRPNSV